MLYIDVERIKKYHYSVSEKYLKIKFEKKPIGSIPYQIKLYKYLKKMIYYNIDNCVAEAKEEFDIFYRAATEKIG